MTPTPAGAAPPGAATPPSNATIGILGGAGAFAGLRCAQRVLALASARGARVDADFPALVLASSPAVGVGIDGTISDAAGTAAALAGGLEQLRGAGADIIGVACNSAQRHLRPARDVIDLASRIADTVAAEADGRESIRVGVLAAAATTASRLHAERLAAVGITHVSIPTQRDQRDLDRRIATATATGRCPNLDDLVGRLDVDVVVLGCTELDAAAVTTRSSTVIDSVDVLARALLDATHRPVRPPR